MFKDGDVFNVGGRLRSDQGQGANEPRETEQRRGKGLRVRLARLGRGQDGIMDTLVLGLQFN